MPLMFCCWLKTAVKVWYFVHARERRGCPTFLLQHIHTDTPLLIIILKKSFRALMGAKRNCSYIVSCSYSIGSAMKHIHILLTTQQWAVSWLNTSLSVGKYTGVVALEGVVEKTFPKALEDHLLTWRHTHIAFYSISLWTLNLSKRSVWTVF